MIVINPQNIAFPNPSRLRFNRVNISFKEILFTSLYQRIGTKIKPMNTKNNWKKSKVISRMSFWKLVIDGVQITGICDNEKREISGEPINKRKDANNPMNAKI